MRAIGNKIIAKMNVVEKTKSGIVLPEHIQNMGMQEKEESWQNVNYLDGVVISVGEAVTSVKPGDKILVARTSPLRVVLNKQKCMILKPEEVQAILDNTDTFGDVNVLHDC